MSFDKKGTNVLLRIATKEITLLGQNVNAYSSNKKGEIYKFSDLIMELQNLEELKRIRYTTSHPKDMTDDLIDCYSTNKKLIPFVHCLLYTSDAADE